MKYNEYIFTKCKNANMANEAEATALATFLAGECLTYHKLAMLQDDALKDKLSAKEYHTLSTEMAKALFLDDISRIQDGDFKAFCEENFEEILREITGDDDE